MLKKTSLFVFAVFILGTLLALTAAGQTDDQSSSPAKVNKTPQFIKKVVKPEGWDFMPAKKLSETAAISHAKIDGIDIVSEEIGFEEELVMDYVNYRLDEGGGLMVYSVPCRPVSVMSLRARASTKIFGYKLGCTCIAIDENRRITATYLCSHPISYIDEDGDGIFESRYHALSLKSLPDWVKRDVEENKGSGSRKSSEIEMGVRRAPWREQKIENYDLTAEYRSSGFNPAANPVVIKVRNGKPVSMDRVKPSDQRDIFYYERFATVDMIFDEIDLAIQNGAYVQITYDKRLKFPSEVYFDYSKTGTRAYNWLKITEFRIVEESK